MTDDDNKNFAVEPRSPVEAAADPAHGGGTPAFTEFEIPGQGTVRMGVNPMTQDMSGMVGSATSDTSSFEATGQYVGGEEPSVQQPSDSDDSFPAAQTITAGIERLRDAAKGARSIVGDLQAHVLSLRGSALGLPPEGHDKATGPDTSTFNLHSLVDDVEDAFRVLRKLVVSAKAAHG